MKKKVKLALLVVTIVTTEVVAFLRWQFPFILESDGGLFLSVNENKWNSGPFLRSSSFKKLKNDSRAAASAQRIPRNHLHLEQTDGFAGKNRWKPGGVAR